MFRNAAVLAAGAFLAATPAAFATSGEWLGTTDSDWSVLTNWSSDPSPAPGIGDIAYFWGNGNGHTTLAVGNIGINQIQFDVTAAAFTLGPTVGAGSITFDNNGRLIVGFDLPTSQRVNSNIILGPTASGADYYIDNNILAGQTLTIAGNITGGTTGGANTKTLNISGEGATMISGAVSATEQRINLKKTGGGVLTVSGSVSNQDTITINGAGLATFSGGVVVNAVSAQERTITFTGAGKTLINSVISTGTASFGHLTYNGAGTLILSGANTYNGDTNINVGTVLVNGTNTGGRNFNVSTGKLGGTGAISPSGSNLIGVNNTATLAPGDSTLDVAAQTGTLDISTRLYLRNTSTYAAQLGGATPGDGQGHYDQVNVGGLITLESATIQLSLSLVNGYAPSPSDVFYILTRGDGAVWGANKFVGAAEGATVTFTDGSTGQVTYLANWGGTQGGSSLTGGNDMAIYNVVAVPEPTVLALTGVGLFLLVFARKRRRA